MTASASSSRFSVSVFLFVLNVFSLLFLYFLLRFQSKLPITCKWISLTVISYLSLFQLSFLILVNCLMRFSDSSTSLPSGLLLWSAHICIPLHFLPLLFRSWRVYFVFQGQNFASRLVSEGFQKRERRFLKDFKRSKTARALARGSESHGQHIQVSTNNQSPSQQKPLTIMQKAKSNEAAPVELDKAFSVTPVAAASNSLSPPSPSAGSGHVSRPSLSRMLSPKAHVGIDDQSLPLHHVGASYHDLLALPRRGDNSAVLAAVETVESALLADSLNTINSWYIRNKFLNSPLFLTIAFIFLFLCHLIAPIYYSVNPLENEFIFGQRIYFVVLFGVHFLFLLVFGHLLVLNESAIEIRRELFATAILFCSFFVPYMWCRFDSHVELDVAQSFPPEWLIVFYSFCSNALTLGIPILRAVSRKARAGIDIATAQSNTMNWRSGTGSFRSKELLPTKVVSSQTLTHYSVELIKSCELEGVLHHYLVEQYKGIPDRTERQKCGQTIIRDCLGSYYLNPDKSLNPLLDAARAVTAGDANASLNELFQINVSDAEVRHLSNAVAAGDYSLELFDELQTTIFQTMKMDLAPRFFRSKHFNQLKEEIARMEAEIEGLEWDAESHKKTETENSKKKTNGKEEIQTQTNNTNTAIAISVPASAAAAAASDSAASSNQTAQKKNPLSEANFKSPADSLAEESVN